MTHRYLTNSKSYTIVLNTLYRTGGLSGTADFFFDWSRMEEDEYIMTVSLASGIQNLGLGYFPLILCTFLSGVSNTQTTVNTTIDQMAQISSYAGIGYLPAGFHSSGRVITLNSQNTPIYLRSRPHQNNFNVSLVRNYLTNLPVVMTDDVLYTFNFTPIKSYFTLKDEIVSKYRPYTFVLNSTNSLVGTSTTRTTTQFEVNWSVMPDTKYAIYWNFMTQKINIGNPIKFPFIYSNFLDSSTSYDFRGVSSSSSQNYLGYLRGYRAIAASTLFLYFNYSSPTYISKRPTKNLFDMWMINPTNGGTWADYSGQFSDFVLNLYFFPV